MNFFNFVVVVVTPTFHVTSNIFGTKKHANTVAISCDYQDAVFISDGSVMLILAHNFKFNIQHHLVVVDDIVGGGRILCDGSLCVVTCLE